MSLFADASLYLDNHVKFFKKGVVEWTSPLLWVLRGREQLY